MYAEGEFMLTGDKQQTYTLDVSSEVVLTKGTDEMRAILSPAIVVAAAPFDENGVAVEKIIGSLAVPEGQPAGAYSGQYSVTANY